MRLPRFMLRHTISVEPYLGEGAYGPTYGPPAEVRCWVDSKRGTVRAPDGSTVTSSGAVFTDLDQAPLLPVGSRVTHRGHVTYVLDVARADAGGLSSLPEHIEATLG